ncbi:MAG: AAA family ATPase [Candidatus Phytoplasma vitis]|nr:MAG: ATP-binding protein [Candidatus Phytoplasma vitis]
MKKEIETNKKNTIKTKKQTTTDKKNKDRPIVIKLNMPETPTNGNSNLFFWNLINLIISIGVILSCLFAFLKSKSQTKEIEQNIKNLQKEYSSKINDLINIPFEFEEEQYKKLLQELLDDLKKEFKKEFNQEPILRNNSKENDKDKNVNNDKKENNNYSSLKDEHFSVQSPENCLSFKQLVGLDDAKNAASSFITYVKNRDLFENKGKIKSPTGLLMYGVGGTGKTAFAKSLARETDLPFIEVSSSIFSQTYYGVAPKMVKDLFKLARKAAVKSGKGAIIFLDECENLFSDIATLTSGSEIANVVNEFKIQLEPSDNLLKEVYKDSEEANQKPVFVVGATNHLEGFEKAILSRFSIQLEIKPGRFDERRRQLFFILFDKSSLCAPITSEATEYLLDTINLALDFLPPENDAKGNAIPAEKHHKKSYRILKNMINDANQQSVTRVLNHLKNHPNIRKKESELEKLKEQKNQDKVNIVEKELNVSKKEVKEEYEYNYYENYYKNDYYKVDKEESKIKKANYDKFVKNNEDKQKTPPEILQNCHGSKSIDIDDLKNTYKSMIDNEDTDENGIPITLKLAEEIQQIIQILDEEFDYVIDSQNNKIELTKEGFNKIINQENQNSLLIKKLKTFQNNLEQAKENYETNKTQKNGDILEKTKMELQNYLYSIYCASENALIIYQEKKEIERFIEEEFKDYFIKKGSNNEATELTSEGIIAVNDFFQIENILDPKHMVLLQKIINSAKYKIIRDSSNPPQYNKDKDVLKVKEVPIG